MPRMKHPDSKQSIEVSPAQVAQYESQGWEKQPSKKHATTTSAATAKNKE